MTSEEFQLLSLAEAIATMPGANNLVEQKERVELAIASNQPALALDTSKSLLESVMKTIILDRVASHKVDSDMSQLFRTVKEHLTLNQDDRADTILKRIGGNLVHNVAELRNSFGVASHGGDGFYENPLEMPEMKMIARMADALSGLLIFKHKASKNPKVDARILYEDYPEFNDFVDSQWEEYVFQLGGNQSINIPASKILFSNDEQAYREMLLQYASTEK